MELNYVGGGWCLHCVICSRISNEHLLVLLIRILSVFMTVKITFTKQKHTHALALCKG